MDTANEKQFKAAEKIYNQLIKKNIEVLFDDRDARAGVKFNDSDLLGIPFKIIVGKNIEKGEVEIQPRKGEKSFVKTTDCVKLILKTLKEKNGI